MQGEHGICGDAFDAAESENDPELELEFGKPGQRVNCPVCLQIIAFIYETYTPKGKIK